MYIENRIVQINHEDRDEVMLHWYIIINTIYIDPLYYIPIYKCKVIDIKVLRMYPDMDGNWELFGVYLNDINTFMGS